MKKNDMNREKNLKKPNIEHIDLDIDHYNLDDLLNLFHLPHDFDERGLKAAKQIVLQMHPDKSHLDAKYFLFFTKAFKTLYSLHVHKNKSMKERSESDYADVNDNEEKNAVLSGFFEKNKKLKNPRDFNQWFNKEFEKTKVDTEETQKGYGAWLRSDEDIESGNNVTQAGMNEAFEKKKRELRALVVKRDEVEGFGCGSSSLLSGSLGLEAPQEFEGGLFSKLPFQDLQQAHKVSVIPVSQEDYAAVKKFSSMDEYKRHRDHEAIQNRPLSETQAIAFLRKREETGERESTDRAYRLAKQMEEAQKKAKGFWGGLQKIGN
jgi:hypothetical protein